MMYGPLSVEQDKRVIGVRIGLAALEFDVILDPTGVNFDYLRRNFFYRPWFTNLYSQKRKHTVVLTWPHHPAGTTFVDIRILPTQKRQRT